MKLYFIAIVSIIVLIILGDETVRILAGILIALGAIPLWSVLRGFFQRQFWHDVSDVISSGEPPKEEPPSDQA